MSAADRLLTPAEVAAVFRIVPRTSPTFPDRVIAKIDASGDCWEWIGTIDSHGYGVIGRGVRGAGNMPAHRAVWELLVGSIPEGMHYDHLCRNHRCVNPDHGEIVTPAVNRARGYGMNILHRNNPSCSKGHPKDGMTGGRGSSRVHRYCKACARLRTRKARKGQAA